MNEGLVLKKKRRTHEFGTRVRQRGLILERCRLRADPSFGEFSNFFELSGVRQVQRAGVAIGRIDDQVPPLSGDARKRNP